MVLCSCRTAERVTPSTSPMRQPSTICSASAAAIVQCRAMATVEYRVCLAAFAVCAPAFVCMFTRCIPYYRPLGRFSSVSDLSLDGQPLHALT